MNDDDPMYSHRCEAMCVGNNLYMGLRDEVWLITQLNAMDRSLRIVSLRHAIAFGRLETDPDS